jgi:tRNA uridine 5-carboxymethylaminomethyl modification enzyme
MGIEAGCVSAEREAHFRNRQGQRDRLEAALQREASGGELAGAGAMVRDDGVKRSLAEWLRFPEVDTNVLVRVVPELVAIPTEVLAEAVEDHRYAPYVERQEAEIARLRRDEAVRIPADIDYAAVAGLSLEMIELLAASRPATLAAAARLRGITPAALAAIMVAARRRAA